MFRPCFQSSCNYLLRKKKQMTLYLVTCRWERGLYKGVNMKSQLTVIGSCLFSDNLNSKWPITICLFGIPHTRNSQRVSHMNFSKFVRNKLKSSWLIFCKTNFYNNLLSSFIAWSGSNSSALYICRVTYASLSHIRLKCTCVNKRGGAFNTYYPYPVHCPSTNNTHNKLHIRKSWKKETA